MSFGSGKILLQYQKTNKVAFSLLTRVKKGWWHGVKKKPWSNTTINPFPHNWDCLFLPPFSAMNLEQKHWALSRSLSYCTIPRHPNTWGLVIEYASQNKSFFFSGKKGPKRRWCQKGKNAQKINIWILFIRKNQGLKIQKKHAKYRIKPFVFGGSNKDSLRAEICFFSFIPSKAPTCGVFRQKGGTFEAPNFRSIRNGQ